MKSVTSRNEEKKIFNINVSYLEIYNEQINDLIGTG